MRNINLIFHVQYHPVNFRQKICSSRDRERDKNHNGIVRTQSVDKFGNPTVIKRSYFGRPSDRIGWGLSKASDSYSATLFLEIGKMNRKIKIKDTSIFCII